MGARGAIVLAGILFCYGLAVGQAFDTAQVVASAFYQNRHRFDTLVLQDRNEQGVMRNHFVVKIGYGVFPRFLKRIVVYDSIDILFLSDAYMFSFRIRWFFTVNKLVVHDNRLTFHFHVENILTDIYGMGTMEFVRIGDDIVFQEMRTRRKYIAVHPLSKKKKSRI